MSNTTTTLAVDQLWHNFSITSHGQILTCNRDYINFVLGDDLRHRNIQSEQYEEDGQTMWRIFSLDSSCQKKQIITGYGNMTEDEAWSEAYEYAQSKERGGRWLGDNTCIDDEASLIEAYQQNEGDAKGQLPYLELLLKLKKAEAELL